MKIHILFLPILFLLYHHVISGQEKDCLYEDYTYLTDRAMLEWNEGDVKASLGHFREAMALPLFPRGRHVAMALNGAVKTGDTTWARQLAFRLVKAGIPLVYFDRYKDLVWYADFVATAADTMAAGNRFFNFELRKALLELRQQDSVLTEDYHRWMKCEHDASLEDMIRRAEGIRDGFVGLIRTHGFPSEKRMGYYYQDNEVNEFPVLVILIHIYQFGTTILKDHLHELVCDGAFSKVEMAVLQDFRGYGNSTGISDEMKLRFSKRSCP